MNTGATTSEAVRASSSTTPRLSRGDIPATWTQPAEVVSVVPEPAARPLVPTAIVLCSIAACVVLAVALLKRPVTTPPITTPPVAAPSVTVPPPGPRPIDEVPEPTPTASSIPTGVAPEDQGGAERPLIGEPAVLPESASEGAAKAAPTPAVGTGEPTASAMDESLVDELPARKKARGYVQRGEKLLLDGDAKSAEPLLRRAAALDPTYADAWRNLGIARATLGDTKGARIAYKLYLKALPDAPDAAEVRKILADSAAAEKASPPQP